MTLKSTHFWPFGWAQRSDLLTLSRDGNTLGLDLGRCESIDVQGLKTFGAVIRQRQGDWVHTDNTKGITFGTMSSVSLDGNGAWLDFQAGRLTISSLYSTKDGNGQFSIKQTGGRLIVNGAEIDHNSNVAALFLDSGEMIISGSQIKQYASTGQHAIAYSGQMSLLGNHFDFYEGPMARQTPAVIEVGTALIRGNANTFRKRRADQSGQGVLLAISNSGSVWANNDMGDWRVDVAPGNARVSTNI